MTCILPVSQDYFWLDLLCLLSEYMNLHAVSILGQMKGVLQTKKNIFGFLILFNLIVLATERKHM